MFLIFMPKYQILTDLGKMEAEKIANEQTRPGLSFEKKNENRNGIFVKPRGEFLKYLN